MFWINHIEYEEADKTLARIYKRLKGPNNNVDNILKVHSLRPHTLTGHMGLYKNVIHNSNNTLPKWYLEAIGVYVSYLNKCDYCVDHHFVGLKKLWNDEEKSNEFYRNLLTNNLKSFFNHKWMAGLNYSKALTMDPSSLKKTTIETLQKLGFVDGEILEINQVASYFNYANRTVLGLGVHSEGDILGLSPNNSNDPDNWKHH